MSRCDKLRAGEEAAFAALTAWIDADEGPLLVEGQADPAQRAGANVLRATGDCHVLLHCCELLMALAGGLIRKATDSREEALGKVQAIALDRQAHWEGLR